MKSDLATYIDDELKSIYPVFQWKVVKNTKKRLIEVYITFNVKVDESLQVQDVTGRSNMPGSIQFEDVICFYDPAYAHIKPQNYLEAVIMNSHTGIEKGYVDACIKQLNIVAEAGITELEKFALDNVSGEFRLVWSDRDLEGAVQTLKSLDRYDEEKIQMKLDEEESFIDQIKKDEANGGVERI
ncbi:DUF3013 family protein [Marinilactibacillus sp. Marseille-P9653]|uniref:DUF3013 family protein n=1 Tax=Marinilactibacillus sp. Marseille-P9653 TaxID=2866583 RepID=UPI001CE3C208|nr:DUF3013 family protein [Marinilactibacillus sp. Marseille-P9653]